MIEVREKIGEPEVQELYHPRRNGWKCPWHPLQFLAWGTVIFFTVFFFGFLVFYIPGGWRSAGYFVAVVVFLTHATAHVAATSIDPAEDPVREKYKGRLGGFLRSVFDRKKHEHVIENYYCNLCDVNVSQTAKHCRVCDKCVVGFDHHCIWLNNCVGSRNYSWFMVTVFTTFLACLILLLYTFALFVTFFTAREYILYACSDHFVFANTTCDSTIRLFGADVPSPVFSVLVIVVGLVATVGAILTGYLGFFHVYLTVRGMSTYDYVVLKRGNKRESDLEAGRLQEEEEEEDGQTRPTDYHGCCCCLRRKLNRVTPLDIRIDDSTDISSCDSLSARSMANFGRTPIQSARNSPDQDDCDYGYVRDNLPGSSSCPIPVVKMFKSKEEQKQEKEKEEKQGEDEKDKEGEKETHAVKNAGTGQQTKAQSSVCVPTLEARPTTSQGKIAAPVGRGEATRDNFTTNSVPKTKPATERHPVACSAANQSSGSDASPKGGSQTSESPAGTNVQVLRGPGNIVKVSNCRLQTRRAALQSRSAEELRPRRSVAEVVSSVATKPQSKSTAAGSSKSDKDLQFSRTIAEVVSSGQTQPQSRLTASSSRSAEDLRPRRTFADMVSSGRTQPHLTKLSSVGKIGGGSVVVLASSRSTLPIELDKEDREQLPHGRALSSGRALKQNIKAGSPDSPV